MRLSKRTQKIIRETVAEVFGVDATVSVFGSRVYDNLRGGDIDLLIKLTHPDIDSHRKSLQLVAKLQLLLGDQSIDVLLIDPQTRLKPIHKEGLRTGIRL